MKEQEAQRITQALDVRTDYPEHVGLLFVFGTRLPEPAHLAADLIKRGVGEIAVLTGDITRATGLGEARPHLEIMLRRGGVPRQRIIVEDASNNTPENVTMALPKISAWVDPEEIDAVAVVTKWYHCRRAMMTLKRHLPFRTRYVAVTYEPEDVGSSNWWQGEKGFRRMLKEVDTIPRCRLSEDIAAIAEDNVAFF